MSLKVSEKHGVNPSCAVCFFCQEETGELLLLGRLKNDAEAPRKAVFSYIPCDKCKEKFKEGILIIEVTTTNYNNVAAIQPGAYPTGNYWLAKKEALINASDVMLVTPEVAKESGLYPQE